MWPFGKKPRRQQTFVFEATTRCNHACLHCYNAWKNPARYRSGLDELPTDRTLDLLGRMIDQTGAGLVTLTGGEPLLRADIYEIIDCLHARGRQINLISNGSLLDDQAIARTADKISIYELPLLSAERAVHDHLSGLAGAFDRVTMALASLKAARQRVVAVFVATKLNLPGWQEAAELAIALGADGIMFNRFNPGGTGGGNVQQLQAGPDELARALEQADRLVDRYKISISCSIPMPPCLFDHQRYPNLGFGFCAAGTDNAYYTLDPQGNLRPCNHSPLILGNLCHRTFDELASSRAMRQFMAARPAFCAGCKVETQCQGGCKAAAEACVGDACACDPFLAAHRERARKL